MSASNNSLLANDITSPPKFGDIKAMKMLIVEDSILLREVLLETINNLKNLSVKGMASTKTKAISMLDEMQFDILLLDIELSEGNGFDVIEHTKLANYPFKPPVLMILTNHTNSHYLSMAKALGVHYFFDKSLEFDLAIQAIEHEVARFNGQAN